MRQTPSSWQVASIGLMATLYIRDVADEVAQELRERATAEGTSLSTYVGRELSKLAARPTNADVVARLKARDRSGGPTSTEIAVEVRAGRW